MDRYAIRKEILSLLDQNPLNNVEVAPIIEKFTDGLNIDEQAIVRLNIESILSEMKNQGDITFYEGSLGITGRSGGVFFKNSILIRTTIQYEKEKETKPKTHSIYVEGGMMGNINTGNVGGNLHQENINKPTFGKAEEDELKSYGITDEQVDNLNQIVSSSNDKPTLTANVMKWLGSVGSSVAAKGLYDNFPAITDFIHRLIS